MLHTWLYAAFLEDPLTWVLLAVGTAFALAPVAESRGRRGALAGRGLAPAPGTAASRGPGSGVSGASRAVSLSLCTS